MRRHGYRLEQLNSCDEEVLIQEVEHLHVALNISFHHPVWMHGEAAVTTASGKLQRAGHKLNGC